MRLRTAIIILLLLAASLSLPLTASDASADDASDDPVIVKTGSRDQIRLEVDSGGSAEGRIFIVSNAGTTLLLESFVAVGDEDISVSSTITVDGESTPLLHPGTTAEPGVAILTVALSADRYAESGDYQGTITIRAEPVNAVDPAVFELEVPFTVSVSSALASGDSYNRFFGVVPNTLSSPFDGAWVPALVTFAVSILIAAILSELIIPLFTRLVGDRKTREEKKRLTSSLTVIITGIVIVYSVEESALILGAGPEIVDAIGSVSKALFIVFGALLAWKVYMFIVTAFLKGIEDSDAVDGIDTSLLPLFKMIGRIAIAVSACCTILSIFGVDLASIMISAGVITLGITLGAQSILGQFFSGIVLLATRPFKKGDYVLMNGETYVVEKVRIMFTEFRNWSGDQMVTIPNDTVSSSAIRNVTRSDPWTRVFLDVTVAYGSDVELCKRCLVEAACSHPHVISDGRVSRPSPRLQELGKSGMTFRLAVWVDDYDDSIVYSGEIRELMYEQLRSNGVVVPYERHQVEILEKDAGTQQRSKGRISRRLRTHDVSCPCEP